MKYAPWLVVLLVAGLWVRAYGDKREADALAKVRGDSLMIEIRRARTLQAQALHVDSLRMLAESAQVRTERKAKRELHLAIFAASDQAGRRARDSLLATLPDTAPLAIQIRAERQIGESCLTALGACDSTLAILTARNASKDTLLSRGDSVNYRLEAMWRDAERRARPSLFGKLRTSLPLAAIAVGVVLLVK